MANLTEVFADPSSRVLRTFLVVDMNDSTAMKVENPEAAWITTLGWFFDHICHTVTKEDGKIIKYVGDGALVVFNEEDATQALSVAIAIQEGIKEENKNRLVNLTASIGVASGYARLFSLEHQGEEAIDFLGSTVDRAFRLCDAANGNAIFADADTIAAARMNRVRSQVGEVLDRVISDYQGQQQLISVKGFSSPVKYHEIWWNKDKYGVSTQFVTGTTNSGVKEIVPRQPRPAAVGEKPVPEWLHGTVKRWGADYGFVTDGREDFYSNTDYLFHADFEVEDNAEVVFTVLDSLAPGKSRRAENVFVIGQNLRGVVTKVDPRGFGFGTATGQGGREHDLFLLVKDVPELKAGDPFECTIGRNPKGPIGEKVRIVD
ncbi:MAG: adenylate/guanylate cyclase domain-containing protein [bacterium]|nr:adenylate/guanylate cyclase domain-containing protein [bacterium]